MKILQVIPYFYPAWSFGGSVRCVYHISRELAKRGHEVTVLTTNAFNRKTDFAVTKKEFRVDGIRARYFRNRARFGGMFLSSSGLHFYEKEAKNSDILHMHEFRTFQNVVAYTQARKHKKPYVLSGHGTIPVVVEKFLLKRLFDKVFGCRILKHACRCVASSKIEVDQFAQAGVSRNKIVIIPNGLETESFKRLPQPGSFKKKFGIAEDTPMILYVGRVHRRKGLIFLMNSFAGLNNLKAVLVIGGPDDGYMSELKERTSHLKISDKVVFTGFLSEQDKLAAYVDSEVVVYPGKYESFPLVPLEAALCSKPVAVSDDSIMSDVVMQGGFGWSLKYGSVSQLTNILKNVLNDPKTAEEMGRRGKDYVEQNFNWRDIVSRLEYVYSDALSTG